MTHGVEVDYRLGAPMHIIGPWAATEIGGGRMVAAVLQGKDYNLYLAN